MANLHLFAKAISIIGLALACALPSKGQESSVVLTPVKDVADAAMERGDSKQLSSATYNSDDPVENELVQAYLSRIELRTDDSNNHAERCIELSALDVARYYMLNVRCRALRAGNDLIEGNYPLWSHRLVNSMVDVSDHVRELIRHELPGKYTDDVTVYYPGTVSLPILEGPAPTFSRTGRMTSVPRVKRDITESPGPFYVRATLNGVGADFVLDTGASATIIGGRTASALGLNRSDIIGRVDYHLVFTGEKISSSLARIDSLRIGDFVASNATVLVNFDENVLNIIGLDLIGRMGSLRFSDDRVTFDNSGSCSGGLSLASDLAATQKAIVGRIDLDGLEVLADIDTGSGPLLILYGSAIASPRTRITVNGVDGSLTPSTQSHPLGAAYNLGTEILKQYDMTIDLKSAGFCLQERTTMRNREHTK